MKKNKKKKKASQKAQPYISNPITQARKEVALSYSSQKNTATKESEMPACTTSPVVLQNAQTSGFIQYRYDVCNTIAFLIGVPKNNFYPSGNGLLFSNYTNLQAHRTARIVRNLSILRTALLSNYKNIQHEMLWNKKTLLDFEQLVPIYTIEKLKEDSIDILSEHGGNISIDGYIVTISSLISRHIEDCKDLFQPWLNWSYVKELFASPFSSNSDVWQFHAKFNAIRTRYPYGAFLNCTFDDDTEYGNILYNDEKFVDYLYQMHNTSFTDRSKLSDPGAITTSNIHEFLSAKKATVLVVDCENADPYKLFAVLKNIEENHLLKRIKKMILYYDSRASSAWTIFESLVNLNVEYKQITRIKEDKSLVDISLSVGVACEFAKSGIDNFILVSSDSDYWALISNLPEARFFVLMEKEKCCSKIRQTLQVADIRYCFMDDFCTADSNYDMRIYAVLSDLNNKLRNACHINLRDMFAHACKTSMANLSSTEEQQIYDRYVKNVSLNLNENGDLSISVSSRNN